LSNPIIAIVWTYNPDVKLLAEVLSSTFGIVNGIVVVDNGSENVLGIKNTIRRLCPNALFIELGFNSGVHALNIGMHYALKMGAKWILLLDDDTVLIHEVVHKMLESFRELSVRSKDLCERIIAISLMTEVPYYLKKFEGSFVPFYTCGMFSGTFVKADAIRSGISIRENFFLDQADFDFFNRLRGNYITVQWIKEAMKHRLGKSYRGPLSNLRLPYIGAIRKYEDPFRYYYIVRNSTILLIERRIPLRHYAHQLVAYFIPLVIVHGLRKAINVLVLGLAHGILRKEGYLDLNIISSILKKDVAIN